MGDSADFRIGILGGKGTGKSYFVSALVHCLRKSENRGAVMAFIRRGEDSMSIANAASKDLVTPESFCDNFENGLGIPQTIESNQRWITIRLFYRKGPFGLGKSIMPIDVEDLSGELLSKPLNPINQPIYERVGSKSRLMIFCLPVWVAFPGPATNRTGAQRLTREFAQVIENHPQVARQFRHRERVLSVVALTMADNPESILTDVREAWVNRYRDPSIPYELENLHRPNHLCAYLTAARRVSRSLHRQLEYSEDGIRREVAKSIRLKSLSRRAWLLPVSAYDGQNPGSKNPLPVHVELLLLAALCMNRNVLM